jgi:hypothetical protein
MFIQITLLTKEYLYYYDDCIKETLFSKGMLYHGELKRYIEDNFVKKKINDETFQYHKNKLIKDGIICEPPDSCYRRGGKRFYILTEKAKQEMRLGLSIKSSERKNNIIFKNYPDQMAVTYFLTLCTLATKGKWLIMDNDDYKMGTTIKEIREHYAGTFGFSPCWLEEENIAKVISSLLKEGIIQGNVKSLNADRFFVSDIELSNFINELIEIFQEYVFPRFFMYWRYIGSPRPKDRIFFQIHYGNKVNQEITLLQGIQKEKKRKLEYRKMSTDLKYKMYLWGLDTEKVFKEFFNKYSEVKKKHIAVTNILLEVFYPESLQKEIGKRIKKYECKKPLKIVRININSITESND